MRIIIMLAVAAVTVFATSCSDHDALVGVPGEEAAPAVLGQEAVVPLGALRFTGRDSFGVALKAHVRGEVERRSDGRCAAETVRLTGAGQATHLGRITAEHSHCLDPDDPAEVSDGLFSYTGTTGAYISGRYEGTFEADTRRLRVRVWVNDGAVPFTDDAAEGRGSVEGRLSQDGTFRYDLDGWLLHHVRDEEE